MSLEKPRFIGSANPFKGWAEKYFNAGFAPVPLPPGRKSPVPTGWTGHGRPVTTEEQLSKWLAGEELPFCPILKTKNYPVSKANIALRLNSVVVDGVTWDLVGIDVDHHPEDVNDPKDGGTQLITLERQYGELPQTWTSSARTNGIAGIRFYRAPSGLAWRGDCGSSGPDIDIISKNYRFAVCFPSTNPDANDAQYWWYPPGFEPNGEPINREDFGYIPDPKRFPLLPDKWVDFLSQNRIPDLGVAIDMNSTNKQLDKWSLKTFAPHKGLCEYMKMILDSWEVKLVSSNKSHNVLVKAHHHMLKCGAQEHHHGWAEAVLEFERIYTADTLARGKREGSQRTISAEIRRSRYGALRRIKGEADEARANNVVYFDSIDPCELVRNSVVLGRNSDVSDDGGPPDHHGHFPISTANDPNTYETTDWGNAEHFRDLHTDIGKYVANARKWIFWDGDRWVTSRLAVARALYRRVKVRQDEEAQKRMIAASGNTAALKAAQNYMNFAKQSGNLQGITRALDLAGTMQGIEIRQEQLDSDRRALSCENGVVKWDEHGNITMVDNARELLFTKSTGIPYVSLEEQRNHPESDVRKGYNILGRFLKSVQPQADRRDYLQKLLGQCLLGSNPYKIALFFYGPKNTGKTTLLELMLEAIGEYGRVLPTHLYQPKTLNPVLADALPLRIVGTDELGNSRIGSDLFKTITGNGSVTVELKGSNMLITDQPQFTPIITTNTVPNVPGEDAAFRDRLVVIPFNTDVRGKAGDPYMFKHNLEKYCGMAMLAWLIEGCERAIKEGIRPFPDWIIEATGEFAASMSDIGVFIREHIVNTGDMTDFVPNSWLWSGYMQWANTNGFALKEMNTERLSKSLVSHNFSPSAKRYRVEGVVSRGFIGMKMVNGKLDNVVKLKEPGSKK